MIRFENVSKTYHIRKFHNEVIRDVSFELPVGANLGICGANGAGKSTLMRLIAGVEFPTSGKITRRMTTSWPIGYTSAFQSSLTGADNARFIARVYNREIEPLLEYVEDFAQLGAYFYQPISTYSAGMLARLAFGVSLAIDFDCYLVDEVTAAGDERFQKRCEEALHYRRENGTLVMISHAVHTLRIYCSTGAVMHKGKLTFYDTIDEAIDVHAHNQAAPVHIVVPPQIDEIVPAPPQADAVTVRGDQSDLLEASQHEPVAPIPPAMPEAAETSPPQSSLTRADIIDAWECFLGRPPTEADIPGYLTLSDPFEVARILSSSPEFLQRLQNGVSAADVFQRFDQLVSRERVS